MEVSAARSGSGRDDARLLISVVDDGCGLPEGFDPQRAGNLGLQDRADPGGGELGGTFDMVASEPRGTKVVLDIPASPQK